MPSTATACASIAFADYFLSDIDTEINVGRSIFVTKAGATEVEEWQEIPCRMNKRKLCLVVARKPVPFQPDPRNSQYILVYVTEQLDCGHELTVYPQTDPLVARRRLCPGCATPTARKPAQSVAATESKKAIA